MPNWWNLPATHYDTDLGWVCPILGEPGATVTDFRMGGETIPLEQLRIDAPYIRFIVRPQNGITDAKVGITLLRTHKKIEPTIIVAVISLAGVLATALVTYLKGPSGSEKAQRLVPSDAKSEENPPLISPSAPSPERLKPEPARLAVLRPQPTPLESAENRKTADQRVPEPPKTDEPKGASKKTVATVATASIRDKPGHPSPTFDDSDTSSKKFRLDIEALTKKERNKSKQGEYKQGQNPVLDSMSTAQRLAAELPAEFAKGFQPASINFNICKPIWPTESLNAGHEGTIILRMTIATTGAVKDVEVVKSTGFEKLDAASVDAVSKCQGKPATRDGAPVEVSTTMQYHWTNN